MAIAAKRTSQVVVHIGIAFAVAYAMTGSAVLGGLAVLIEPLINVMALPFHEKAWARQRSKAVSEQARFGLLAAEKISQTALHAIVAFAVMFAATGSVALGGAAALLEPVCNVLVLPYHDRIWDKLLSRWQGAAASRFASGVGAA
jgi:uncharacterized membrane protein